MDILSLISLAFFSRRKAKRFLYCSGLCLLYSILYSLVNKAPVALTDTAAYDILRVCEMVVPVLLFVAVLSLCGKHSPVPVVIAGLICAARIAKFIWVRHYINMLLAAGESALELTALGIRATNIHSFVLSLLFFLLNIALFRHYKKSSL